MIEMTEVPEAIEAIEVHEVHEADGAPTLDGWFWTARRSVQPVPALHASDVLAVPILVMCAISPTFAALALYASLVTITFAFIEGAYWAFGHARPPANCAEHFWVFEAPLIGVVGHVAWTVLCCLRGDFANVSVWAGFGTSLALIAALAALACLLDWSYALTPNEMSWVLVGSMGVGVGPFLVAFG